MSERYDSRALLPERTVALNATGNVIDFHKDGLTYYAKSEATTTAVSCPPYDTIPPSLRFVLDNSNGSGSLTMTPTGGGTATVVTTGKVFQYYTTAAGTLKATELAAMPT